MFRSKIFILVCLVTILMSGCTPALVTPSPGVAETPALASGAVVKSIDVQILESFPIQVHAVLRGDLPDASCTTISSVDQVRQGNTFQLTLVTTTDPLARCASAPTPFEEVVPLDVQDLPAGTYVVRAGDVEQTFEFSVDNTSLPTESSVNPTEVEYVMAQQDVSIYTGPGEQYSILGMVAAGQTAKVTGVSTDEGWWRVICPDDSVGDCWVSADPSLTQPAQAPS